jgi:hypothetical protein
VYKSIINPNSGLYLNYGYLTLPLNLNIISKINIGTGTFYPKNGYHVSLIRLEDYPESDQKKVLEFAKNYPVKLHKITKNFRLVTKADQQSIIIRVRLQGLKPLISAVNRHFGYSFVYPPVHITLFTLKSQYGVGIDTQGDYRQFTQPISQKDSQRLAKSFKLI